MLAGSCPNQDTEADWTLYELSPTYSTYSTDQFQTHNASDYDLGWLYLYSVEITKGGTCCCVAALPVLSGNHKRWHLWHLLLCCKIILMLIL